MFMPYMKVVLSVSLIKFGFYCLDPIPQFYGGDSFSYLYTKINHWIPQDRSFVYGLLLGAIGDVFHSITPLIILQIMLSCISCLLLYYCLMLLELNNILAFIITIIFALDPLQLLYERYIMAETISEFFFVVVLTLTLNYLKRPCKTILYFIPMMGIMATALRVNYYPSIIFLSFFLPIFVFARSMMTTRPNAVGFKAFPMPIISKLRLLLVHMCICIFGFLSIHFLYTHWYGKLLNRESSISYTDGFFMLSGLWNIVIPSDSPNPQLAHIIATRHVFFPDHNPAYERNNQRFGEVGIIGRWERTRVDGPPSLHDNIAKITAINAIKRVPLQVINSTISNYFEYFRNLSRNVLDLYERNVKLSQNDCLWFKAHFGLPITEDWRKYESLTQILLFKTRLWCFVLLITPPLSALTIFLFWRSRYFEYLFILSITSFLVFLPGCIFIVTNIRLLHPLCILALLVIAMAIQATIDRTLEYKTKHIIGKKI